MSLTEGVIETDLYVKPTDSISIYSLARATLSIVKKGIPYSQIKLHLFRNSFDKRCIDLERFLFERGYSSKLAWKGILWARKSPRNKMLDKENSQGNDSKLTFNVVYHSVFRHMKVS